jgi:predicted nucleotide-binding protein (sugar kinase/HSP70/actin superfamily)
MVIKVQNQQMMAAIRQQIEALSDLVEELETENLSPEALGWRIKAIELQLRQTREASR